MLRLCEGVPLAELTARRSRPTRVFQGVVMRVQTLMMFVFLLGCSDQVQQPLTENISVPRTQVPRDYGDIENYHACQAQPRRELSDLDKCEIEVLSQNCSPAADCLVTCISSPDGYKRGGGCFHVCFNPPASHTWESRPRVDFGRCEQFELPASKRGGDK